MTMVERLGETIREELFQRTGIVLPKVDMTPVARAAIAAMLEPLRDTIEEELRRVNGQDLSEGWITEREIAGRVLDAALSEK